MGQSKKGFEAVVTSDLHLKTTDKYGKTLPNGRNTRLQDRLDGIKQSVDYALEHKVDYWICLGDIFHRINPSESLRKDFIDSILPLFGKIPTIFLIGNHDTDNKIFSLMTERAIFDAMNFGEVSIYDEPKQVQLNGINCLMLPWSENNQIIDLLDNTQKQVIFGHFGVKGALTSTTEFVLKEGIPSSMFNNHRFAFLGHYHKPQHTPKYIYLGSSHIMDMGERNDAKRFLHIRVDENDVKYKSIDYPERPFITHIVEESEDPDFEALNEWGDLHGAIVKLTFVGEENWALKFNLKEVKNRILKDLNAHMLFTDRQTLKQFSRDVPEINMGSSWDEGIKIYCKKKKKPELVELGKKLLKEVM